MTDYVGALGRWVTGVIRGRVRTVWVVVFVKFRGRCGPTAEVGIGTELAPMDP